MIELAFGVQVPLDVNVVKIAVLGAPAQVPSPRKNVVLDGVPVTGLAAILVTVLMIVPLTGMVTFVVPVTVTVRGNAPA